ncbi:SDR family oxidoreductase [Rhodobacterales bacterium]|nr:SDR family oxidoreductase [Rhodobacterales bacterium]
MKKAVVLGAYGFIGAACVRALQANGYAVCGVGRSMDAARQAFPDLVWVLKDISRTSAEEWAEVFQDADVVVNAAGALQDGARDNLEAIHVTAVERMLQALEGRTVRFIQISAAGVSEDAPTDFFRTKARGDALVTGSDTDWIVLRPSLVLGPHAYGGTALLRAAAATPLVGGRIFSDARVQTVHVDDVAAAVAEAAAGKLGSRFAADLSEGESRSFPELVGKVRTWLGFPRWAATLAVPESLVELLGKGADALGWLGWRSPLRTNALAALRNGIVANPSEWRERGGVPMRALDETLAAMPATAQERVFARLYLLLPFAIACLSLFWVLSGVFGVISLGAARSVLTEVGVSPFLAGVAVLGGSVVDIALGLGVLVRRWSRLACLGMVAVSLVYLLMGSLLTPALWLDPLGPFVKILPSAMLAVLVALVLEKR